MTPTLLFYIIIGILLLNYTIETLLDFLNARHFNDPVPELLDDVYPEDTYRKSQRYKREKFRFGILTSTLTLLVTLLFFFLDGFELVDGWARQFSDHTIFITLIFFGIIFLAADLLGLPFSYYHTFVIEEKFGFNTMTRKTFFTDKIKGLVMTIVIGGLLLGAINWFYSRTGSAFWLYAWGIIGVFTIFMNLFYSRLIVPIFNKQTPLQQGSLREKIEEYASGVGFTLHNIFVIDGSKRSTKANAYFSGFGKEKRITLYDTLLNDLEEEEVVAVLAHEVGHYKKNHIVFNLLAALITMGITLWLLSLFIDNALLSSALGVSEPSFHIGLIAFGILYSPLSEVTGLLMHYLSRKFEYQADAYARLSYNADDLISALKKLSRNSLSNLTPHPAYVFVHYSHPTLLQRFKRLKNQ